MRGLIERLKASDPEALAALHVITRFDALVAEQADLRNVIAVAEELAGVDIHVRDELNDRQLCSRGCDATPEPDHAPSPPARVPLAGAEDVEGVVVAPIAVASGPIGAVWTGRVDGGATEVQQVVVERLAAAAAIDALRVAEPVVVPGGSAVLAELAADNLDADQAALLVRRAGLPDDLPLVPVVVEPSRRMAPDVVAAALRRADLAGVAMTVSRHRVMAACTESGLRTLLERVREPRYAAWLLRVGVGPTGAAHRLSAGWAQARHALTFSGHLSPLVRSDDLGALTLLPLLPTEALRDCPDVAAVKRLALGPGGEQNLTLLARYCETGSLRQTAAELHWHHSSVGYRLKKAEQHLGFELDSPSRRMRALLAVWLWQIERSRGTAT